MDGSNNDDGLDDVNAGWQQSWSWLCGQWHVDSGSGDDVDDVGDGDSKVDCGDDVDCSGDDNNDDGDTDDDVGADSNIGTDANCDDG